MPSKVERYKWQLKDSPGTFLMIPKESLEVDDAYQRACGRTKVLAMSSNWSWVACGAIIVAMRGQRFFVIDGWHRVQAAKKRDDIAEMPCLVFETEGVAEEATGFLNVNTGRKNVTCYEKFKAKLAINDSVAIFIRDTLESLGLRASNESRRWPDFKCLDWAATQCETNRNLFVTAVTLCRESFVADDAPMDRRTLSGLCYIGKRSDLLTDKRFRERFVSAGGKLIKQSIQKAVVFYGASGDRIYAKGILDEVNKNLRNKFSLTVSMDTED